MRFVHDINDEDTERITFNIYQNGALFASSTDTLSHLVKSIQKSFISPSEVDDPIPNATTLAAMTDRFSDQSDVDVLVDFWPFDLKTNSYAKNYFSLISGLENVFNRAIDLVTVSSLRNRLFMDELNRTRLKVYDAHEDYTPLLPPIPLWGANQER